MKQWDFGCPGNAETHLAGVLSRHTLIRSVRSYQYPVAQICALFSDLNAFAGVLSLVYLFSFPAVSIFFGKRLDLDVIRVVLMPGWMKLE